jgi:subtilisin family serine protease
VAWDSESHDDIDTDSDGDKHEAFGHGTHVAGIVRLAAPSATLIAIKVLNDDGWGRAWGIARGIKEAIEDKDADVINLSLGFGIESPVVHDAIRDAASHNVVVVAAAGNHSSDVPEYPAAWDEVISVTAVDRYDHLAEFANWHPTVDLSAPGVDIVSSIPDQAEIGSYAMASGGSMATAWVSSAAALVREIQPGLPPQQVSARLKARSVPIDSRNLHFAGQIGAGRLNLFYAVTGSSGGMTP